MKFQFIILLLLLITSCGQGTKEEKKEPEAKMQGAIEVVETVADTHRQNGHIGFDEVISAAKSRTLPVVEMTNFDSFIDEDDYDEIDAEALKLDQIYPDFNNENHLFRLIAYYQVPLSNNFHTIVITLLKGEHEMKTVLINYDTGGSPIAHQEVAFDEVAEGMSRTVSRISENKLTVNKIFWGNTKEVEEIGYEIRGDGTIEKVGTKRLNDSVENFTMINSVLMDLKLDWVQTKTNLISTKEYPDYPDETIVVIPEIVDEGEQYFDLNSHIVIADNRSGKITHHYFESNQTNQWVSDAIELDDIQMAPNAFKITENKSAFGLYASYFGHSRANPYQNKTLSLFMKSENSLIKVLADYTVVNNGGEWNGDCDGKFKDEEKAVVLSTKKTNGHFDVLINNKITETKSFKDNDGECQTEASFHFENSILEFNGKAYVETDAEGISYAEYQPQELKNFQIENFDVAHSFELNGYKIVSGNYYPEDGKHFASDTETETDWGDRLLLLDASNEIIFQSKGVGDVYLFEPHFYKSDVSNKIIIICQKANEYPFGGEAFMFENGSLKYIGTLDIEEDDEENYLTDILEIKEREGTLVFALKSEEVILKPGSEDMFKTNKNVIYVYQNNELALKTN